MFLSGCYLPLAVGLSGCLVGVVAFCFDSVGKGGLLTVLELGLREPTGFFKGGGGSTGFLLTPGGLNFSSKHKYRKTKIIKSNDFSNDDVITRKMLRKKNEN